MEKNFEKWLEDFNSAFSDSLINYAKYRGGLKMKDNTMLIPEGLEDKTVQLYAAYKNERTTKNLVWATWFLAIGTLILSILTLYLTFFTPTK
jgi:hypothetical protein